jgi:hypothetical protein
VVAVSFYTGVGIIYSNFFRFVGAWYIIAAQTCLLSK